MFWKFSKTLLHPLITNPTRTSQPAITFSECATRLFNYIFIYLKHTWHIFINDYTGFRHRTTREKTPKPKKDKIARWWKIDVSNGRKNAKSKKHTNEPTTKNERSSGGNCRNDQNGLSNEMAVMGSMPATINRY